MNFLLHKNSAVQKPVFSHARSKAVVQPKLSVNRPGDQYELEADEMAERVMRTPVSERSTKPLTGIIGASVKRKRLSHKDDEPLEKPLMRKAENPDYGIQASPSLVSSLNGSRGGGSPLPEGTRSFMENAFSTDFSAVRIHTGEKASGMNDGIHARAFTSGSDIYFNNGEYSPNTEKGKELLVHELTHVVQQESGSSCIQCKIELRPPGRGEASAFGRAQELIDRLNGLSAALDYRLEGNTLLYTVVDEDAMTNFDTRMKGFIDQQVTVPLRLVPSTTQVIGDSFWQGYVDLDDLMASDDLGFQSQLLHFLAERFNVNRYAQRIGTEGMSPIDLNTLQVRPFFNRAHQAGHQAQVEHFREVFNDPDIVFNYEEAKPSGNAHIVFKSRSGKYRIFLIMHGAIRTPTSRVRATSEGTVRVLTSDGQWYSVEDFLRLRASRGSPAVQPKLKVNSPGDKYEQEADAMAEKVVRMTPGQTAERVSGHLITSFHSRHALPTERDNRPKPLMRKNRNADPGFQTPDSLDSSLNASGGGSPLSSGIRRIMENAFSTDFSRVKIHSGSQATEMNRQLNARAFTFGRDIYFNTGQFDTGSAEGNKLLAHELTHVVQQRNGGENKIQLKPQKVILPDVSGLIQSVRNVDSALLGIIAILEKSFNKSGNLPNLISALKDREVTESAYANTIEYIAKDPSSVSNPEEFIYKLGFVSEISALFPDDAASFEKQGVSLKERISLYTAYHSKLFVILQLIQPKISDLIDEVSKGGSNPDFVYETYYQIIGHYVNVIKLPVLAALSRYAFLTTYYHSSNVVNWYAIAKYIRINLPPFYDSLYKVREVYMIPRSFGDIKEVQGLGKSTTPQGEGERRAFENIRNLSIICDIVGDPPSSPTEVTATYLPVDATLVVNMFLDAHALIAVLALLKTLESLSSLLNQALYAGTSLTGLDADNRSRWISEITDLRGNFMDEIRRREHPDLEKNYDPWTKRLQVLVDEIPPSIRKRLIVAAVAQEIPFLFVGGATVVRVGIWVKRITGGSRLLIALAEGATMTTLQFTVALGGPSGSIGTVKGWFGQLAFNVAFAGIGRLLFEGSGSVMDKIAKGRNLFIQLSGRVGAPLAGMTLLQTTAQYIQQKVSAKGGETKFTELLTINLILNGMGILIGLATMPPGAGGDISLLKPGKLTAAELAKEQGIPVNVAQALLEIADMIFSYRDLIIEVQSAAKRGILTPEQFEQFRKSALDIIDFLSVRVPVLAPYMEGNLSASTIAAIFAELRTRVTNASYDDLSTTVALLPEATKGLVRVGDTDDYLFRGDKPPSGVKALIDDNTKRGIPVKQLPGGGWEVLPSAASRGMRLLPAPKIAIENISPSVDTLANGPVAQSGLSMIRTQQFVTPTLIESSLAAGATTKTSQGAATNLLQILSVLKPELKQSWQGLANYFNRGGDVITLRRVLNVPNGASMPAEKSFHVASVLAAMVPWETATIRGLQALYRVRPMTTTEAIGRLIYETQPDISRGFLESIGVLEPMSKGLNKVIGAFLTDTTIGSSALSPQQIGAIGALRSAIELYVKYPGAELVFEEPQKGAGGAVERVVDVNVYETVSSRVAGVTKTVKQLKFSVEVKEVSVASLGKRAPHQLAMDIIRDSRHRSAQVVPVGASRPFFETIVWKIRRAEFEATAMKKLGISNPKDPDVEVEMRRTIQSLLEPAFNDPALKGLSKTEVDGYKAAFSLVSFVEFF